MDSASFFTNGACPYFPCHEGVDPERFNCLFCYCPLYALGPRCGGAFTYTERGVPTVIVNGDTVDGTALPYDSSLTEDDPLFMCMGYEYGVNAQSVTIANQSEHTLQIASICIEYSIIPNSLKA